MRDIPLWLWGLVSVWVGGLVFFLAAGHLSLAQFGMRVVSFVGAVFVGYWIGRR